MAALFARARIYTLTIHSIRSLGWMRSESGAKAVCTAGKIRNSKTGERGGSPAEALQPNPYRRVTERSHRLRRPRSDSLTDTKSVDLPGTTKLG